MTLKNQMTFTRKLGEWYRKNRRDMPWRDTRDPYLVWLSEIILQQTRVEQGTPYYNRFAGRYPTVGDLARAEEQEVLKLWQGLGYYSRARNLHSAAQSIVEDHQGIYPSDYAAIRKLKGVGDYTAAAIASICFGLPYPVIDGNVIRFASRFFGISGLASQPAVRRKILDILNEHIDRSNPGDFNQAMMEFGALVCVPAAPACVECDFKQDCYAFRNNLVGTLPERDPKPAVRDLFIHYMVFTCRDKGTVHVYLNHRSGKGIWKNLYDFPAIEKEKSTGPLPPGAFSPFLKDPERFFLGISKEYTHILSHRRLHVFFYRFHSDHPVGLPFAEVSFADIQSFPVPRLIERYLTDYPINQTTNSDF